MLQILSSKLHANKLSPTDDLCPYISSVKRIFKSGVRTSSHCSQAGQEMARPPSDSADRVVNNRAHRRKHDPKRTHESPQASVQMKNSPPPLNAHHPCYDPAPWKRLIMRILGVASQHDPIVLKLDHPMQHVSFILPLRKDHFTHAHSVRINSLQLKQVAAFYPGLHARPCDGNSDSVSPEEGVGQQRLNMSKRHFQDTDLTSGMTEGSGRQLRR
jgi:hypothetical protein